MTRVPRWLRIGAGVLAAWSIWTGLLGCALALPTHWSDVYRDAVGRPFLKVLKAGAIDLDRLGEVVGANAYAGKSAAEREAFEEDVRSKAFMYLSNLVVARVERDTLLDAAGHFGTAAICLFAAIVSWVQAGRVSSFLSASGSASSHR